MILYWLFFILIISFFTRHYESSDKVKIWLLILFAIYFIKKIKISLPNNENMTNNIPVVNRLGPDVYLPYDNTQVDNKFNNFLNKLFIIGNRNTSSLGKTKNKNINL